MVVFMFVCQINMYAHKAILLHHSVGGNVYTEGQVTAWITNYNIAHGTNFQIDEHSYPDSPWPWNNYPYDYWKLWVDGSCNNSDADIACLDQIAANYELVIFKHCFPGADLRDTELTTDLSIKTNENYKYLYRQLLKKFDSMPNKKFLIWTLAPENSRSTDKEQGTNAYNFVQWVKYIWRTEDGKLHPNVFVFDFFGLVAEMSSNPASGIQYGLKTVYQRSTTDGHPNTTANLMVGPLFAQAVVDILKTPTSIDIATSHNFSLFQTTGGIGYSFISLPQLPSMVEVTDITGRLVYATKNIDQQTGIWTFNNCAGIYIIRLLIDNQWHTTKIKL
jgi:hypothetical protein